MKESLGRCPGAVPAPGVGLDSGGKFDVRMEFSRTDADENGGSAVPVCLFDVEITAHSCDVIRLWAKITKVPALFPHAGASRRLRRMDGKNARKRGNIFLILLKRGKYLVYLQAQKTNFTVLQKVLSLRTCRGKGERLCTFVYYNRHGEPVAQLIERT